MEAILVKEKKSNFDFKKTFEKLAALSSLIIMMIFFSIFSEYFFTTTNLLTIALQTSVIGIIAIGQTVVIVTGGIDLSVGSIVAFSGVTAGLLVERGVPLIPALILGVLIGAGVGILNGALISKANLPPFIATLGMMMVLRGLTLALTNGMPISSFDDSFVYLAGGSVFGIPNPVIYFISLGLIFNFILKRTVLGKDIYAIGSNEEAARLSGVNVVKTKLMVYGFCGFLSGISGIILASRLISAQPTEGAGYELDAVAAVVIGGASLSGGKGNIIGTIIGAFIMSTLRNGLNMMNVSGFWQQFVVGIVLLLAVYVDQKRKK
ncbi:ABC transporter permease [Cetobacterium sp.]|uniref:ABC transporter permease n=1 Tax=Cetobacterium sp. TaxID=2071632 RepID=UPI003EE4C184